MDKNEKLKNLILEKQKENKLVINTIEGLFEVDTEKFIDQPTEGILYDLGFLPEVVLTNFDDESQVNDYAVSIVITKLKEKLEQAKQ